MTNTTKEFDYKCKEFTANGKKYFVNQKLSIARFEEYQKLEPRLAYGIDFETLFQLIKKQYTLLNDRKFADAAVISHNIMNGIGDLLSDKRTDPALLMAALAIVGEGEDPGSFDEQVQLDKIADWRAEGYDMEGFFYFAASTINGLPKAYKEYIMQEVIENGNIKITS